MKKRKIASCLAMTLLLMAAMSAKAQDIKIDTVANYYYAEIVPQKITFLSDSPQIKRVCVPPLTFSPSGVVVNFWLMYQRADKIGTNQEWGTILSRSFQWQSPTNDIQIGLFKLFEYISDSLNVDVTYK